MTRVRLTLWAIVTVVLLLHVFPSERLRADAGLPLLDQANLVYLGAFSMPLVANGTSTAWGAGTLAIRHVNGRLQFFSTNKDYKVYETNDPGLALAPPYPQAKVIRDWGDVYSGKRCTQIHYPERTNCAIGSSTVYGLYFDEDDGRLYWNFGDKYANDVGSPAFGYSTLDEKTGTGTGIGSWSLSKQSQSKAYRGGTLRIPDWFARQYTGGKRLGVGFGGYYSIGQNTSMGPTLFAVNPPDPAVKPHLSSIDNVPLALFPGIGPKPGSGQDRGHRNPNYTALIDWPVSKDTGYWQWTDTVLGGAWPLIPKSSDGPGVEGVLFFATMGQGTISYSHAAVVADHRETWVFVLDPADLAKVASGQLAPWKVQPRHSFRPTVGSGAGVAFDPATRRLFVIDPAGLRGPREGTPVVHVYQVTDTPALTPPAIVVPPASTTIDVGKGGRILTYFNVIATGTPPPTYSWQVSRDNGAKWENIPESFGDMPGAFGSRLVFAAVSAENNGNQFRVVVTNANGSTTSSPATLTLAGAAPAAPAITAQPPDVEGVAGHRVTLTAGVSGVPSPDLQWQLSRDKGKTWKSMNSLSSNTYTIKVAPADNGNQYRVRATTKGFPAVFSDAATLKIVPLTAGPPRIAGQPGDRSIAAGRTAKFGVDAMGKPAPTFQWQRDGVDIPGAHSPTYTTPVVSASDDGATFQVVVSNASGQVTSRTATLRVR